MDAISGTQETPDLFTQISDYLLNEDPVGIDPRVFHILDNVDSPEEDLAAIERMIDVKLALRLRNMANSVYYGMTRRGAVTKFNDVITSIGMQPSKLFIIALALFARLAPEYKKIEIESFAISLFARLIAEQVSLQQTTVEKAEIGGLFLNLGKVVIASYATAKQIDLPPGFFEEHHRTFAARIFEKLTLPDYLLEVIKEERFMLRKTAVSVSGVVYLAQALVEKMIRDRGGIEIKAPAVNVNDTLETSLALKIRQYFNLIGLGAYLKTNTY